LARYTEPTNRQVEEARAFLFLSETKKALRSENIRDAHLELDIERNVHNQAIYHVHATRGQQRITAPEGRPVNPITDTPYTIARMLASDARTASTRQAEKALAEPFKHADALKAEQASIS
jgi:hypothetical protein